MVTFNRKKSDTAPEAEPPAHEDISNSGMTLLSFVERIERLTEEKDALGADIREVYGEAKGTGFDAKVMRKVIALRKMDKGDRQEMEALLELYLETLDKAMKQQTQTSQDEAD